MVDRNGWIQVPISPPVWKLLASDPDVRSVRAFVKDELMVLVASEPIMPDGSAGWHISISHPTRYPTWEEQKDARYSLVPDSAYMVSVLPPIADYLNVHPNCFHWWQVPRMPWM